MGKQPRPDRSRGEWSQHILQSRHADLLQLIADPHRRLLDLDDPTKVIARQAEPILEPELDWEVNGYVPNVVFSCGQVVIGDELFVYYGGADTAIGVAKIRMDEIVF